MTVEQKIQLNTLLNEIGKALDVTKSEHEIITSSYEAVGYFLANDSSPLNVYEPMIRPQGSFLLGTVVRPVAEDADLDIDLVCELIRKPASWTQFSTKNAVGDRLKFSERYSKMLDKEGKRCWTLKYADNKYHMDILPCFVSEEYKKELERMLSSGNQDITDTTAVRITDNTRDNYRTETNTDGWPKSNPFGFAKWFYNIAYRPSTLTRTINLKEAIAPVPKHYETKAPLQRAVQLLKRHRDIMFKDDGEDKPISIIITTLASRAYNDSTDLLDTIQHIALNMSSYIKGTPGHRVIENPVNPSENFADRWNDTNNKETNFYKWLAKLQTDINRISASTGQGLDKLQDLFKELFGEKVSTASFKAYADNLRAASSAGKLTSTLGTATLGTAAGATVPKHNFYGKDA